MKIVLFTFLALVGSLNMVNAQWSETFDSGSLTLYPAPNSGIWYYGDVPTDWTEYNVDQTPFFWTIAPRMAGKGFRTNLDNTLGVSDTVVIASSSFGPSGGTADDWLVTPQFSVPTLSALQQAVLFWNHKTYTNDLLDYEILLSTTGNAPADFSTVLWTSPSTVYTSFGFEFNNLDLSAYAGQTIYLAYHYTASYPSWGSRLLLDDFELKITEGYNVDLQSINTYRYKKSADSQTIKGSIFNWGPPITQLDIVWDDGGSPHTMTLSGLSFPQFSALNFDHTIPFSAAAVGEYPITVTLQNINGTGQLDSDPSDNTLNTKVSVVQNSQARNVVLEKQTGTWCPWCPRGIVALDTIKAQIPDGSFIPIAVHIQSNDPMTVSEYEQNINLPGSPTCKLDRHPDYDSLGIGPVTTYPLVVAKKDVVTPATLNQTLSYDSISGNLTINCSATFFTDISTELRFASVITEDSLSGQGSEWGQANGYSGSSTPMGGFENLPSPVPGGQIFHNHVARALIGGINGQPNSITGSIQDGDSKTHTFIYQVPDSFKIKDMHVITFVLDNGTGELLNAITSSIQPGTVISIGETSSINFDAVVYPSPLTSENLNLLIESKTKEYYSLTIYSTTGEIVFEQELGRILGSAKMSIPISKSLPSGLYLVNIGSKSHTLVKKIFINR